eukprot:m.38159 g.38159  ORF g.38159 m.38159 type:complete len:337 (-) comp13732_c0_seq1:420-1430(-)
MPWFLGLRSARYGWVQEKFNPPSDFTHPDRFGWMDAALSAHPHGLSITSLEVWHALLGRQSTDQQPHAFFAFRNPTTFMSKVDPDWQWVFDFEYRLPTDAIPDTVASQYQRNDKCNLYRRDLDLITEQIKQSADKGQSVWFEYDPAETPIVKETGRLPNGKRFGTGTVQGLDFFAQQVFSMLFTAIDKEYPAYDTPIDTFTLQAVEHELLARSLAPTFVGREAQLETLQKLVLEPVAENGNGPVMVHGPDGVGKSALLAQLVYRLPAAQIAVVKHFVGANASSFAATETLTRLCVALARASPSSVRSSSLAILGSQTSIQRRTASSKMNPTLWHCS